MHEEIDDERDENDEGRGDQAFQKPVFLGGVPGGDAENEKEDDAGDECGCVEG